MCAGKRHVPTRVPEDSFETHDERVEAIEALDGSGVRMSARLYRRALDAGEELAGTTE